MLGQGKGGCSGCRWKALCKQRHRDQTGYSKKLQGHVVERVTGLGGSL